VGTGVPGDKILRIILKNGVILSLHQKSDGGGQNILRGGVSLYRMILISGFYCILDDIGRELEQLANKLFFEGFGVR
jgi:hypothetical protein